MEPYYYDDSHVASMAQNPYSIDDDEHAAASYLIMDYDDVNVYD